MIMKHLTGAHRLLLIAIILMGSILVLSATTLINENIQSWTASTSYGTYTQVIPAGTVSLARCLVSPNAAASGTGSIGRIQCSASDGVIELPLLPSIGQAEFHIAAGSSGRSVKLQKLNGATWEDLTTFTGIAASGATFTWDVNLSTPSTIRLAIPSHAIYIHDIIVTDFQNSELPIVTTTATSGITYTTAISGGNVEYAGTTTVTARGVCWSTTASPDLTGSHTTDGNGIGSFISNITGLSPETDYYVRAYATNTSGTSYGEQISFRSGNIGVPSLQASRVVFYPGNTSIQATWTPGNGARRIVKINAQNNFTNPVNGIDYPANAVYDGTGEQVVYNGATMIVEGEAIDAVTVSGLTRNTTYWFRIFDYNGESSAAQYNVLTALSNPASATTLNSETDGYYNGITGTGTTLKTNLGNLIRTTHQTEFSYDAVWTQLQYTDEDSLNTNNVIELYTGWSVPKSYNGGGTSNWNREHTWSKSHGDFGESAPAGTDLHHLRPADATVNSAKGNKDFDNGGSAYVDNSPYSGYPGATGCYTDTDSWEPRTVEKGDIARMILYMATRYEGTDTSYNLEMLDSTPTSGAFYGKLSTLLQWHQQDPPDSWEMRRNNRIQERQGNRNPFIDHPEYVRMIWAPTTTVPTVLDSISFTARWTPAVNATSYRLDVATDSLFTSFVSNYHDLNVGSNTNYNVISLPTNHTYYYRLRSYFSVGYSMYSNYTAAHLSNQPLELTAFTATVVTPGAVTLNWTTLFETGVTGFYIFRSGTADQTGAANITPNIIAATNTASPHLYSFIDHSVVDAHDYYYWLKSVYLDGSDHYWGPVFIHYTPNADDLSPVVCTPTAISRIYPNPFHQTSTVEINVSKASAMQLRVYNLKGQWIKTLFTGMKATGQHSIAWDGKDAYGSFCAPGIYFIRLETAEHTTQQKVLLF